MYATEAVPVLDSMPAWFFIPVAIVLWVIVVVLYVRDSKRNKKDPQ